jgi:hypothetical protein
VEKGGLGHHGVKKGRGWSRGRRYSLVGEVKRYLNRRGVHGFQGGIGGVVVVVAVQDRKPRGGGGGSGARRPPREDGMGARQRHVGRVGMCFDAQVHLDSYLLSLVGS